MNKIIFHFHGELAFFLPAHRRDGLIEHHFEKRTSIKDMVESLGPPHTEIDLLLVDGVSVNLDYILETDASIDVYTDFNAVDLPDKICLRPPLNGQPRFVLDTHLGRLANYLRMLGFDTLYRNDYPDEELAQVSADEQRILLTRDIGLLKRSQVVYGYYVRSLQPKQQIVEVMQHYDLPDKVRPFQRCLKCNGVLQTVERDRVLDQLPASSALCFEEYWQCQDCGQLYWQGSHYEQMQALIRQVLDKVAETGDSASGDSTPKG